MFGSMRLVAQGGQSVPVEMLTYAVLGARLKISPEAARSLVSDFGCSARCRTMGKRW